VNHHHHHHHHSLYTSFHGQKHCDSNIAELKLQTIYISWTLNVNEYQHWHSNLLSTEYDLQHVCLSVCLSKSTVNITQHSAVLSVIVDRLRRWTDSHAVSPTYTTITSHWLNHSIVVSGSWTAVIREWMQTHIHVQTMTYKYIIYTPLSTECNSHSQVHKFTVHNRAKFERVNDRIMTQK